MGHLKPTVLAIIIGPLGKIKKGKDKHINEMPGKSSL